MFHFKKIKDLLKQDEQWFIDYLEKIYWNGKPVSPFDPTSKVLNSKTRKNTYICSKTKKYFTIKTGGIFERSKVPLNDFFYAGYMMFVNKKGISSLQLAEDLGVQYKTAWFLTHRLRKVADDPLFKKAFEDLIEGEADETFIGGENKNRHWDKKVPYSQGRSLEDKIPVVGIIDRKTGTLIAKKVSDTTQTTLETFLKDNVKEGSTIHTDGHYGYDRLYKSYKHEVSNHKKKQYKNTNRIESAWNPFKKSYSIHHWLSEKHLQRYIFQWTFRHNLNTRKINDRKYNKEEKLKLLMSLVMGKRLTYKELVG